MNVTSFHHRNVDSSPVLMDQIKNVVPKELLDSGSHMAGADNHSHNLLPMNKSIYSESRKPIIILCVGFLLFVIIPMLKLILWCLPGTNMATDRMEPTKYSIIVLKYIIIVFIAAILLFIIMNYSPLQKTTHPFVRTLTFIFGIISFLIGFSAVISDFSSVIQQNWWLSGLAWFLTVTPNNDSNNKDLSQQSNSI